MIVGDGHPRRRLERPDDTFPAQSYEPNFYECRNFPAHLLDDFDHIQPVASFTALHEDAHLFGPGITLFYCTCVNRWTTHQHNCVMPPDTPLGPLGPVVPLDWIRQEWVYRDISAGDLSYLENNMVRKAQLLHY